MKVLIAGALLWLAFSITCLWVASHQPWLGLEFQRAAQAPAQAPAQTLGIRIAKVFSGGPADGKLQPGEVLTQIRSSTGASVALTGFDMIGSPTYLPRYAQQNEFLARQQAIASILRSGPVRVLRADGNEVEIGVAPYRPLRALPIPALLQFTVLPGLAMLIAFTVLYRLPSDHAARYLVICALGYACLVSDALYSMRELAFPEGLFRTLLAIENEGGLILLGGSAVALLWSFPAPLTRRPAAPWIYAAAITGAAIHQFEVFETVTLGFWLWCLMSFAAQAVGATLQWRRARERPTHRAMLKWLLVPWFALGAMYTLLFYIPASVGLGPQAPQIVGWILFLLIFVGLAFGMTRFRLYYLNPANLLVWFVDGLLIVALLILGLGVLGLPYFFAGCLALAATGVLHRLVRDAVWSAQALQHADFERVLKLVLETLGRSQTPTEARAAWPHTLERLFAPCAMTRGEASAERVEILDDGESMRVPLPSMAGALTLEMPFRGRGLFMPRDALVVRDLYKVFDAVVRYWDSHRAGELDERLRLSRALDAGLDRSLGDLAEIAPTGESKRFAEEARVELQRISRSLAEPACTLKEVFETLRNDSESRCDAAGVRLEWQNFSASVSVELSGQTAFDLQSIVHEAVTNAIRHSGGGIVRIDLAWSGAGTLEISIEDDGLGRPEAVVRGRGLGNIQRRAEVRGGKMQVNLGKLGGLRVSVCLPVTQSGD